MTVNLATRTETGGDATGDNISDFENVTGSAFADRLFGDGGANTIIGGAGNDTIYGDGPFNATNAVNYQLNGVAFTYSSGANLGNGVSGGTNHVATVASTVVSGLVIGVYDGNNTLSAGETISFSSLTSLAISSRSSMPLSSKRHLVVE